jgi:uncharacterized protein (DUF952 family)
VTLIYHIAAAADWEQARRDDTDLVGPEIRYEHVPGQSEPYPHIYGPLDTSAVVQTRPFGPRPDGKFSFDGEVT